MKDSILVKTFFRPMAVGRGIHWAMLFSLGV
jgi:hypothetical protein